MKKLNHAYAPFILTLSIGVAGCGTDSAQVTTNEAVEGSDAVVEERAAGKKNRVNNTTDWATYRGDQKVPLTPLWIRLRSIMLLRWRRFGVMIQGSLSVPACNLTPSLSTA